MNSINRRNFLTKGTLAASLGPSIIPSSVLGKDAPSNKITVGFIGTGGHGTGWNLPSYLSQNDAKVLMTCDVDTNRMNHAKKIVDQNYGNKDCATSKDFRDVLARDDIDAVMISTPDHWHTLMSVMALRAGKDVQCEKPTLTIDEGKLLIKEVRKHNKVFQTSTEDRAVPVYHRMAELVRNGRIGKLKKLKSFYQNSPTDLVIQPHSQCQNHWTMTCGWDLLLKLHIQRIESYSIFAGSLIILEESFLTGERISLTLLNGEMILKRSGPIEIEGTGNRWEGGLYDTVKDYDVTYKYANGVEMTCKPGNPSIKFIGTDGWVGNTGWRAPLEASSKEILNSKIEDNEIKLFTEPKYEHRNFLDCVKSRKDPYFPVDIGHRVSTVCHLANIAIDRGEIKMGPRKRSLH